ncbi:MAG: ATP-dependent DNA helicase RecQ [bacterium]|nr:ATP-dependent DNA helicase RecQ [bacterium]
MTNDIDGALKDYFGFDHFRGGQREVIEHLMEGHSAAAVFPTGAGKSLCYQLPALLKSGLTLVVSPLIALMKDQVDAMARRNIAASQLDSSLSLDEYRDVMARVRNGQLRMLYVAPERFNNERFRAAIKGVEISLFAVDEAHCISEWGHNFRPDYLKLAGFARDLNAKCVLALTATATSKVLEDVCVGFEIAPECAVRTGFYRSNLTLLMTPVAVGDRDDLLLAKLRERATGSTIIYVTLQKTAQEIADRLIEAGYSARAYHAGMKPDVRAGIQDWFMGSSEGIVVATIAFGMGVDKADIRFVYHYNIPKSLENYSQEIGRAGRDDQPSICEAFICHDDRFVLENFVYGDTPTLNALRGLVNTLFTQEERFDVNLYELSSAHDIRALVLRTLMTYLELEGYLRGGTPFYADYQFKPLMSSREILGQFEGSQTDFLAGIFKQSVKKRIWFHIDPEKTARALDCDREKVIKSLDYLGDRQMFEVKAAGIRHRYQRLKIPDDLYELAGQMFARMEKREDAEITRLVQVLDLASLDSCQINALAAHFTETRSEPCGHCSHCLLGPQHFPKEEPPAIDEGLVAGVQDLLSSEQNTQVLNDPRSLTRFLCGITSPGISRARLTRHNLFGSLSRIPFKQVRDWIELQKIV